MEVNTDVLRRQIMVSQFVNAVGCTPDEATQILTSAGWQLEVCSVGFYCISWIFVSHAGCPQYFLPGPFSSHSS